MDRNDFHHGDVYMTLHRLYSCPCALHRCHSHLYHPWALLKKPIDGGPVCHAKSLRRGVDRSARGRSAAAIRPPETAITTTTSPLPFDHQKPPSPLPFNHQKPPSPPQHRCCHSTTRNRRTTPEEGRDDNGERRGDTGEANSAADWEKIWVFILRDLVFNLDEED
ncbi:hypothetical protein Q3G72_028846 [Acer saccharum]|nr:hypothetical protein Q3G72_028846 [Acer saccharum]